MIKLRKMSQAEYEDYYVESLQRLADELAIANALTPEQALNAAQRSFASLLPEGRPDTTDQHLYTILEGDQKIGVLWFGIRRDRIKPEAYIWDIVIEQPYRGKGYGEQAMLALEEEVAALRISRISLNVFEHNSMAKCLYDKLGFKTVSRVMAKDFEG